MTESEQEQQEKARLENDRLSEELSRDLEKFNLKVYAELIDIGGKYNDEVSLLNEVAGKYF
jgi:hypothetical protein